MRPGSAEAQALYKGQEGLSIWLSWPEHSDGRRSLVSTQTRPSAARGGQGQHLVNVESRHIDLYQMLSSDTIDSTLLLRNRPCILESIPPQVLWIPPGHGGLEGILLSYCKTACNDSLNHKLTRPDENVLSIMLTSVNDYQFRSLLIATSFLDDSASSVSVMQSLYALAALHLYGSERARPFKIRAIQPS
jgi:hypothetical protein